MLNKIHSITLIFVIPLFSISASVVLADASAQTVTAVAPVKNPVGWWKFDGDAKDSSSSNHSVESGNPTYGAGVFGQAISFDGVDDFIVIKDNGGSATIEFDKGSFSIAFWVKSNFVGISNSDIKEFIICNGTNGTEFDFGGSGPGGRASGKRYVITFENDDFCFYVDDDSIKTMLECASDNFATSAWIHVAAVRDTDTKQLLIYRDGVLENSVPDKSIKSIASPGEPLFIGSKQKEDAHADNPANAPMDYYFKGMLDDLRIYNYALSQAEIANIMGLSSMNVSPPSAEMLFEKARKYDRERKYEDAKYYYLQIIQHYPDSPEANRARLDISKVKVLSMFDPEQVDDVPTALDKLIADFSKHPYLPEALYTIAERYQYARKPEKAKALYQDIATDYPDTDYAFESLKKLALLYVDEGNEFETRQTLDRMTQKFSGRPDLADALYEVAERYEWKWGKYKEAQLIYQQIIQQSPGGSPAEGGTLNLSRMNVISLIESGDYSQAQQAIDKLVAEFSKHPDLARTLYGIAGRYEKVEKYDEVKTIYKSILTDYPHTDYALQAQKKLAIINIEQGNDIKGLVALDKLIADFKHHKGIPDAIYEIAQEFYNRANEVESQELKAEKYDYAKTIYRKILTDYPRTDRALQAQKKLAIILFKEGNETAALAALDKLIADFRNHRDLYQTIFEIAEESQGLKVGKYAQARIIYSKILTDYPATDLAFEAQQKLAAVSLDVSNDITVLAAVDKLIADFNDHQDLPGAVFTVGKQYYYQALQDKNQPPNEQVNHLRKAIAVWGKVITQLPNTNITPQAYYYSAVCYNELREYEKAIEYFRKVVTDWPDYVYAWNAQFQVGFIYENLGKSGAIPNSKAEPRIKDAYEQLLKKYPSCKVAKYAKHWLNRNN